MRRTTLFISIVWMLSALLATQAFSHCEIPCGIYDDSMQIDMIEEHITTLETSIKMITELSAAQDEQNHNQLVRWINNKEKHANHIQNIVCQYFMTQRLKAVARGNTAGYATYVEQLTLLHKMLIYAMKAKQTTDLDHIETLRSLLEEFETSYFDSEKLRHHH